MRRVSLELSPWILALAAVTVAIVLYRAVGGMSYCDLDDPGFVFTNPVVRGGLGLANLKNLFNLHGSLYWAPVTTFSFMVDASLFKGWAGGYHVVNLLWHCLNVALFFTLVLRLSGSRMAAFWAALLLAGHPGHIEAVAWITARKDMLSTFFGLGSLLIYISWARRPGTLKTVALYACFALSLMAKPMFATLPGVLLLLDWWPLGRLGRDESGSLWPGKALLVERLREKVLILALSMLAVFLTLSSHGESYDRLDPSLPLKLANALVAYAKYLGMLVWPHNQALVYPFPDAVPTLWAGASAALLAAITGLCLWQARRRPYLLVGWLWFAGTLLPVIMPPKVGLHVAMADRWTYVPFMGLYLALGMLGAEMLGRISASGRPRLAGALTAIWLIAPLACLAPAHQRQLATWATPESIYEQTFRATSGSHLILSNYGRLLIRRHDLAGAEAAFERSLAIHPQYAAATHNLGLLRMEQGRDEEGRALVLRGVELDSSHTLAYDGYRAAALASQRMRRFADAAHYYAKAIDADPKNPAAYSEWAELGLKAGDFELVQELYDMAVKYDPNNAKALANIVGAMRNPEAMARARAFKAGQPKVN